MSGSETAFETPAELLARTGEQSARLIAQLTRQRDSLAVAAASSRLPAGVCAAEGVALLEQAIAAAAAVIEAARTTHPDPTTAP